MATIYTYCQHCGRRIDIMDDVIVITAKGETFRGCQSCITYQLHGRDNPQEPTAIEKNLAREA